MIKSIELKNIQSHENTRLELGKGINVIIGSSNNGKTAILRGLYWVRYNRPLGIDTLASHWALNDKGDLKSPISVSVENDFGIVTRKRTKGENQYIVNGKVLNVVKSDVPEEVEKALCLSDTNIQRQLDEPFLLSKSSGDVAKYFNRVVRLDVIDRVLTNAEGTKRKIQADIKSSKAQVEDCEKKLEGFSWIENVGKLIDKYNRVDENKAGLEESCESLLSSLSNYENYSRKLINLDSQKKLVDEIERVFDKIDNLSSSINELEDSISQFNGVKDYPDLSEQKKLVLKIENFDRESLLNLDGKINSLSEELSNLNLAQAGVEEMSENIRYLKKKFPSVCPLCGSPMKEGCCEKN